MVHPTRLTLHPLPNGCGFCGDLWKVLDHRPMPDLTQVLASGLPLALLGWFWPGLL